MNLRSNWHRKYQAALKFLEQLGTPIARQTLEIIKAGKVIVNSFSTLTVRDFNELRYEYNQKRKTKRQPKVYPPTKTFVQSVSSEWSGAIYGKRIYIDPAIPTERKLAKLIVHEVNHFINDSNNHLDTDRDRFVEELRAKLAERVAFKPQLRITPAYLLSKARKIVKDYHLPLNPKIIQEAEMKARVLKGLK